MAVDAVGPLHPVERRAVLGKIARPSAMRASVTRMSRYSHGALVNSGCESSRSMIRRSGVTPAISWSNTWRDTLRCCASGQMPSRQARKFAAAARMAAACISGWPEAPSSPVHSRGAGSLRSAAVCGGVWVAVFGERTASGDRSPARPPARRQQCSAATAAQIEALPRPVILIIGLFPAAHRNHCAISHVIWSRSHNGTIQQHSRTAHFFRSRTAAS